jgi:membrane protease YdiL (CAAX protease family)
MSRDRSGNFHLMPEANGDSAPLDQAPAPAPDEFVISAAVPLSPFEDRMHKLFIGPEGLRAVWRLVLYVMMYKALRFFLEAALYFVPVSRIWWGMLMEAGLAVIAIAPAFLMALIEGRRIDDYGLPRRDAFGKRFWTGALWGIASMSALLGALHFAGAFDFGQLALHGVLRVLKFAQFWGVFFLLVGLYEEFFLRGYIQFTLTQITGFWPAAILLSLTFGALHLGNPGESPAGIAGAALIGLFFCLTLRRTGSLWFAVGFHTFWDWAQSFLYSVPDSGQTFPGHLMRASVHGPPWLSGGSVGPEASVFLFMLIAVLWLVFDRLYPEVSYPAPTVKQISAL